MNVFYYRHIGYYRKLESLRFSVNLRLKQLLRQFGKPSNRILMFYLAKKGDLENGVESLEVCLSGFPLPDRVEDKLPWNDILKKLFSLHCNSGRIEAQARNPGVPFFKVGLQTIFDSEFR